MKGSILVINPNSSVSVTECIQRSAASNYVHHTGISVTFYQAPSSAPASIDNFCTSILSASGCWPTLLPMIHEHDAFLVACYSDHPLIHMLRETTRKPVMGILEASVIEAQTQGSKFGVLTTGVAWVAPLTKAILELPIVSKEVFVGVTATGLGVLDFHASSGDLGKDDAVENNVRIGAQTLVDNGCNVIVLGCAGMEGMEDAVKAGISTSKEVKVVDGVRAGVEIIAKKLHEIPM